MEENHQPKHKRIDMQTQQPLRFEQYDFEESPQNSFKQNPIQMSTHSHIYKKSTYN